MGGGWILLAMALLMSGPVFASGPEYAGSEGCAPCHAAQYAGQSRSGHARALRRSAASEPGDWAFGAGTQAITFVRRVDRETYREHGETWYRASDGFGITPGHR